MTTITILSWESLVNIQSNILIRSCFLLLLLGYLLLIVPGSVRSIFGLILITFSISFQLCIYGMLFIPLLFLSSLLGLVMILFLLRYGSSSSFEEDDIDRFDLGFLFIVSFGICIPLSSSYTGCLGLGLLQFSIILDSCLLMSFLFSIVFFATLLLIHLSNKFMYFNLNTIRFNGIIGYWLCDALVLFIIGLFLCFLPAFLRWLFHRSSSTVSGNVSVVGWRESVYRWSSDVYEVGISLPGPSLPSSLFSKNGDSESGSFRFLAFVYLFLLLDLESCIVIPIVVGYGSLFSGLFFLVVVLLATSCELSIDPFLIS